MTQDAKEPILTAVFVDYDNIYLSLKKRSEDAAKRFAKDAVSWIKEIESGRLITATNSPATTRPRRIVVNRCYGNPVPRRNPHDNSTDMTSFPFVRHHFLRAGFEVVDCPPLTAQLKNSSDIKMVLDATDFLDHETRFDEFVILSGDADFTPLMHRLRAHDRRTVIFASDFTAAAYTALCDGEVKEATFLSMLLDGKPAEATKPAPAAMPAAQVAQPARLKEASAPAPSIPQPQSQPLAQVQPADGVSVDRVRAEIIAAVVVAVKAAGSPVPLEALAERTTRALGHDRTVGSNWAGSASFLELLRKHLPAEIRLTEQPPYLAYEAARALPAPAERPMPILEPRAAPERMAMEQPHQDRNIFAAHAHSPAQPQAGAQSGTQAGSQPQLQVAKASAPQMPVPHVPIPQAPLPPAPQPQATQPVRAAAPAQPAAIPQPPIPAQPRADMAAAIQASIARIHEACQAPPLSPADYRNLFEAIANEIGENGLQGAQTLTGIHGRAQSLGLSISRDDIRFVMEVISEADPWFEQGASAILFAGRFRNFVVARCRSQNLSLSSDELDLIDAWFAGGGQVAPQSIRVPAPSAEIGAPPPARQVGQQAPATQPAGAWSNAPLSAAAEPQAEQFPKILRTRLKG
jgi:uncharacterized LabA/DUF88 family protein